jgi:hypothetical protein
LKWAGWFPADADEAAKAWATPATAAKANPFIGKAQTQLWTALHKAFIGGAIDALTADSFLTNLIPDAADRAAVIQLWETEANIGKPAGPPA